MIAAHRRAHRRIHALLWPAVAALVGAALSARLPVDAPSDWPGFLAENAGSGAATPAPELSSSTGRTTPIWTRDDAFGAWPARLSLFADGQVEILPRRPLDRPELLVYWVGGAFVGARLPEEARLLGRLTGPHAQRFALPADGEPEPDHDVASESEAELPRGDRGNLVLYSLGHGEIVTSARIVSEVP